MIILDTTQGAKCGGYTSNNWDGTYSFKTDNDAFVFNMTQRFNCNQSQKSIFTTQNGFMFGDSILLVTSSSALNQQNQGWCYTGK